MLGWCLGVLMLFAFVIPLAVGPALLGCWLARRPTIGWVASASACWSRSRCTLSGSAPPCSSAW
jgi:hypothetical protein